MSRGFDISWFGDTLTIRLSAPLLALLCAGLAGWLALFACRRSRSTPWRHPDDVEVVALFANPRIPRRLEATLGLTRAYRFFCSNDRCSNYVLSG